MNNDRLTVFNNNEFGDVRTTIQDGEPWFVAADVCKILHITSQSSAIKRLDDDEKDLALIDTNGGKQRMNIISESGLYSLVLSTRTPEAKAMKRWLFHECLSRIDTVRKGAGLLLGAQFPLSSQH